MILKPVQEDWEQLGLHLNIEQSVLNNIRSKGDSVEQMKCVLKEWAKKGGKLKQIEVALVLLGKRYIAHGMMWMQSSYGLNWIFFSILGVHGLQEKSHTLDTSVQVSIDSSDKSIQCENDNKSNVSGIVLQWFDKYEYWQTLLFNN